MRSPIFWLLSFCIILTLSSCGLTIDKEPLPYVDLDQLEPLAPPQENNILPLKVAIASIMSPQGSIESYTPLLEYISQELGRPVESIHSQTYSEANELVRTGEVDLAFVCTSSYLVGEDQFGMQLLAAPQVNGEKTYQAAFIVLAESDIQVIDDLRGKVFAFTDPISFTGRIYPTYILQKAGEIPESFFERTFFTFSHDKAINAVANGIADSASVDKMILDFAIIRDPELVNKIRIIHLSKPFGMPPVVVGPQIRPQLFATIQTILLDMHLTPEGQTALEALDYDRFVIVSNSDYETAKAIQDTVKCCSTPQP